MATLPKYVHLQSQDSSLIIDCRRGVPAVHYFGIKLSERTTQDMLSELSIRQEAKCALVEEVPLGLTPCLGDGFTGHPGISLDDRGIAWSVGTRLVSVEQNSALEVKVLYHGD